MEKLTAAIEELWHDRKRVLGLPMSFTRYALSNDRIFIRKGMLNTTQDEIILYRIRDLSVKQSLGQKLFGVGSVSVVSTDKTQPNLTIKNVRKPYEVKEFIHDSVEKMKIERRMSIGEMSMDLDENIDIDDFQD